MNKIFFSTFDVIEKISGRRAIQLDSGWGRLVDVLYSALCEYGYEIVDTPLCADIEFFIGQPPLYLKPQMHPAIILSMYETTLLPHAWVEGFNHWDCVINPSLWGRECFVASGVRTPIFVVPLPVSTMFQFVERNTRSWTYLAQSLQLKDRKNALLVAELFEEGALPSDAFLIIKTVPRGSQTQLDCWLSAQIRLVQMSLPLEQYIAEIIAPAQVSVNPSCGEGFGYLPAECMATGMCTIMTDYSALKDLLASGFALPIKCVEAPTALFATGGFDAIVDKKDLLKQMLWTYENRESSLEMGRLASSWLCENYNPMRIVSLLEPIFWSLTKDVTKSISLWNSTDPEENWIDRRLLIPFDLK